MIEIGTDNQIALVGKVQSVLKDVRGVDQQVVIEILMSVHARRCGRQHAAFVIDSMAKHAKQIIDQVP